MDRLALELEQVLPTAADWHARIDDAPSDRLILAQFDAWLRADDLHRLAYAEICAAAYAVEQSPAIDATSNVLSFAREPRARRAAGRVWLMAFAATVLLSASLWQGARPWQNFASDAYSEEGQVRELTLDDGSRVTLGADSAISYEMAADSRRITLLRGEAFFRVEPDTTRPFIVEADGVLARAVGTRYSVGHGIAGEVRVQVEEGKVEVRDRANREFQLIAGQEVRIADEAAATVQPSSPGAFDWREGVLVFEHASLDELVQRLDAYIPGRVVLLGEHDAVRVSAVVAGADAAASLRAIAAREGLRVDEVGGFVTVLR
jgi:transmembrane sensor